MHVLHCVCRPLFTQALVFFQMLQQWDESSCRNKHARHANSFISSLGRHVLVAGSSHG